MRKTDGQCLLDTIVVGEAHIEVLGVPAGHEPVLAAKYALASSRNGVRVGPGSCNLWSEETMKLLGKLLESMEKDISSDLFEGSSTTGGGDEGILSQADGVPSL